MTVREIVCVVGQWEPLMSTPSLLTGDISSTAPGNAMLSTFYGQIHSFLQVGLEEFIRYTRYEDSERAACGVGKPYLRAYKQAHSVHCRA